MESNLVRGTGGLAILVPVIKYTERVLRIDEIMYNQELLNPALKAPVYIRFRILTREPPIGFFSLGTRKLLQRCGQRCGGRRTRPDPRSASSATRARRNGASSPRAAPTAFPPASRSLRLNVQTTLETSRKNIKIEVNFSDSQLYRLLQSI